MISEVFFIVQIGKDLTEKQSEIVTEEEVSK